METKTYSAMLYAMAQEIRDEEGCVTVSAEQVEYAAERMDTLTVTILGLEIQRDKSLTDAETLMAQGHRLALELECLLLETKDTAAVSKWWGSAQDALQDWRDCVQQSAKNETQAGLMLTDETQTAVPAIVFYPAGSLGEEVLP